MQIFERGCKQYGGGPGGMRKASGGVGGGQMRQTEATNRSNTPLTPAKLGLSGGRRIEDAFGRVTGHPPQDLCFFDP